jgi:uncharacterized protein (TIGR04255 family)
VGLIVANEQKRLPNKPLVEAIFELRWNLEKARTEGLPPTDPGFRLMVGRYYERVRAEYPQLVDLPASQIPEDISPYTVRHQFRASKDGWPVTQVGPGIMTVNETENYSWDTFRPRLSTATKSLFDSYPTEVAPFVPRQVLLRYLNAIPFNQTTDKITLLRFLRDYLHTGVEIDQSLFDDGEAAQSPVELNLNLTFPLPRVGLITLVLASGIKEGRPAVIWELNVRSRKGEAPAGLSELDSWIVAAHEKLEAWFFTLCKGALLERFERTS